MLRALFRRRRREADLDDELNAFLAMAEQEHRRRGKSPAQARRAARLELGGKEQVKERVRGAWGGSSLDELARDIRYGLRSVRRNPVLSFVVVSTLALGIGGNAAIFSVVHALLLRPLPYDDPSRLALVWLRYDASEQSRVPASGPELVDLDERSTHFADLAAVWSSTAALTGGGDDPEQLRVGFVTANFFDVLGARPQVGRGFVIDDEGNGADGPAAIILGDGVWRRRYGGDPTIVGRDIQFDGEAVTVVGIMPPAFELRFPSGSGVPRDIQAWVAFPWDVRAGKRELSYLRLLGRLRPGVTLDQARDEAAEIAVELRARHSRYHELGLELDVVDLHSDSVRHVRTALVALMGGVTFVLLIACVNIASLLLGRLATRRHEIALRVSLGASRGRLGQQLLVESLILAGIGGAVGIVVARAVMGLVPRLLPSDLAAVTTGELSVPVLAYTVGVTLFAGLLFGLAPIVESSRVGLIGALRRERTSSGPGHRRFRTALVVGQLALGFLLLIGAGLLLRTLAHTMSSDPGFRAAEALTFQISLPRSRYPDDASRAEMARRLRDSMSSLPGVDAVGAASHLPLDDYPNWYGFVWRDGASEDEKSALMADQRAVTPGYFPALGATLQAGRWFEDRDGDGAAAVVIVDDFLAAQLWPDQDAIGRGLHLEAWDEGRFESRRAEVIGVVRHVHNHDLNIKARGQAYLPHAQSARPVLSWVVRAAVPPDSLIGPIGQRVHTHDPALPLAKIRPLGTFVRQASASARLTTLLSATFAAMALLLAAVGVYGVAAYTAEQRRHEIGVRLALGARGWQILRSVVAHSLGAALAGLLFGILAAALLTRFLDGLIHGVSVADPLTYFGVSVLLLGVTGLAAYLPARRASRIDPLRSLRTD